MKAPLPSDQGLLKIQHVLVDGTLGVPFIHHLTDEATEA